MDRLLTERKHIEKSGLVRERQQLDTPGGSGILYGFMAGFVLQVAVGGLLIYLW